MRPGHLSSCCPAPAPDNKPVSSSLSITHTHTHTHFSDPQTVTLLLLCEQTSFRSSGTFFNKVPKPMRTVPSRPQRSTFPSCARSCATLRPHARKPGAPSSTVCRLASWADVELHFSLNRWHLVIRELPVCCFVMDRLLC